MTIIVAMLVIIWPYYDHIMMIIFHHDHNMIHRFWVWGSTWGASRLYTFSFFIFLCFEPATKCYKANEILNENVGMWCIKTSYWNFWTYYRNEPWRKERKVVSVVRRDLDMVSVAIAPTGGTFVWACLMVAVTSAFPDVLNTTCLYDPQTIYDFSVPKMIDDDEQASHPREICVKYEKSIFVKSWIKPPLMKIDAFYH